MWTDNPESCTRTRGCENRQEPRTRIHPNHNPGERPSVSWLVESPHPSSTSPIAHNPDRARSLKGNSPIARGCQSAAPVTPGDLCRHVQTWRSAPRCADLRIRGTDFQSVTAGLSPNNIVVRVHQNPDGSADLCVRPAGLSSSNPRPPGRTPPRRARSPKGNPIPASPVPESTPTTTQANGPA